MIRAGAACLVLICGTGALRAEQPCSPDRIDLRLNAGKQSFAVEVADDPAERAQGLMFRESLPPDQGMLFVYETPHEARFWMKNTLVALDIVFADATGTVTHVHANARPMDETVIPGGPGVQYVLEINAGLAERLGIAPGALMRHPAISGAAWTCDDAGG